MTADLQSAVQRALSAWDTTTLKTNGDGMLAEAMETLRAEFDAAVQATEGGEMAAFEAWFQQRRLKTWQQAGCDKDRGPEPSENWSMGLRSDLLEGWQARAALAAQPAAIKPGLNPAPAEGDAMLTEEQIDRFIPERIGVRNWGKPEQADLFNRGQVRDAIRTAIASQPNVQPKAAEVDAAPWSKTVESAALLLQRCTGLELQDCENLAGTILGMAANVQPKGTAADHATVEQWEAALSAVMPADFKDWWQNSRSEWPAVAAGVIESQRADRDMGWEMAAKAAQAPAPAPEPVATLWREQRQDLYPGPLFDLTDTGKALPLGVKHKLYAEPVQAPAVGADDEQDAAKYRHWRDHAEVLCAVLRYESPAWIDAYLAEALAERDASKPPVQGSGQ